VLQGGNGCKGKKLYVGEMVEGTHVQENSNKIWFSSHLIVPLQYKNLKQRY